MRVAGPWVLLLAVLTVRLEPILGARAPSIVPSCTAPSAAGAPARAVAGGPTKPSSYAPHPRSRARTYGAPIQRPIVTKHGKRRARTGSRRASAAAADRRGG